MSTRKIVTTGSNDITENTLKLAPARLLTFLQGVGDPAIGTQLTPYGWSEARLEEAWSLLTELTASSVIATPPPAELDVIADATAACEAWQATGLVRARAMLQLTHPEQASFLFHDYEAGAGAVAVLNVATFLTRREALEKDAARKEHRKGDQEALAIIEESGTTKKVLRELKAMVDTVQSVVVTASVPVNHQVNPRRTETLRKIHAWLTTWNEVARTVVRRRDHQIRLGIAKRRTGKGKSVVSPPPVDPAKEPPVLAPPPVPTLAGRVRSSAVSAADEENGPSSRAA